MTPGRHQRAMRRGGQRCCSEVVGLRGIEPRTRGLKGSEYRVHGALSCANMLSMSHSVHTGSTCATRLRVTRRVTSRAATSPPPYVLVARPQGQLPLRLAPAAAVTSTDSTIRPVVVRHSAVRSGWENWATGRPSRTCQNTCGTPDRPVPAARGPRRLARSPVSNRTDLAYEELVRALSRRSKPAALRSVRRRWRSG